MDGRNMRDSAFVESTDVDGAGDSNMTDTSLDLLEQQQAREQARLLQRFRELRQWQQQQQEQLMQQQQMQLEMLRGEQLRVQTVIASQRGAHWGEGKVSKPDGFRKSSPPLMTPPRRAVAGLGAELAKTMMSMMPHASADSGLVASMGDTLDHPKDSLPRPIMYLASPSVDDDKYTNPELFSNPGSYSDDLQAVDDRAQYLDNRSDVGSDNFILPPLPPEPRESDFGGLGGGGLSSLKTLQVLMSNTAPNFLQQMLGLLPSQQKALLLEQRQAAVEESASPTFSPVNSMHVAHSSEAFRAAVSSMQTYPSQSVSLSHGASTELPADRVTVYPPYSQASSSQIQRQPVHSPSPLWPQNQASKHADQAKSLKPSQQTHHHRPQQGGQQVQTSPPRPTQKQKRTHVQQHLPHQPQLTMKRSFQEEDRDEYRGRDSLPSACEREMEMEEEEEEELEVTVKECGSPDDRPITGVQGRKTFEQLIEEQLASERQKEEEEAAAAAKQTSGPGKRRFLHRGEGIARFSKPIKRPPPKRSSGGGQKSEASRSTTASRMSHDPGATAGASRTSVQSRSQAKRQLERKLTSGGKEMKKVHQDEDPPQQEKLKLIKRKSETGKKSQPEPGRDPQITASKQTLSFRVRGQTGISTLEREGSLDREEKDSIPDDMSFVAGLTEREKNEPMEAQELEEFEMLEDIADNMSLVSNSSIVKGLITPNKQRQKTAVSDLKTVLEKKKNAASSPFERNAAMRSLLSVNIPCLPFDQPSSQAEAANHNNENDTLVDEKSDDGADTSDVSVTESDDEDKQTNDRVSALHGDAVGELHSQRADQNVFPGVFFLQKGQQIDGLEFSSKFSFFDQQKRSAEGANSALDCPPSPMKSVTRKVATIQSRLSAANDTAALLQKLSAHAGYLSSGFSQTLKEKSSASAADDEHDESQGETSILSSMVPQPLVIGGVGKSEDKKSSGVSGMEKTVSGPILKTQKDSDDEQQENSEVEEKEEEAKDESDDETCVRVVGSGVRWTAEDEDDDTHTTTIAANDDKSHQQNANSNSNVGFEFDDEEEWTSGAPHVKKAESANAAGENVNSTPPTSKLMSRLFPNLKPKPTAAQQQQQQKLQMASTTNVGDGIQSKILREKLAELEAEIEKFRSENSALEKLRKEREEGVNKLKEEIARFEQEKTAELRRLEEFKAQEIKKLKQERKLFETYQKQVRAMPDKKDREEIEMLKNQLSDLQDEMKRKESRWTSNVTRLKSRIVELEGENAELREEMKLLERKRLEWMQSAKAIPASSTAAKSAPRSSTPTSSMVNGHHNGTASSVDVNNFNIPQKISSGSAEKASTLISAQMNASGAAGKMVSGPGSGNQNSSGGESMPRGQASTPSMIEGMSPMSLGDGGEGPGVVSKKMNVPPAFDRPTVDKGNRQYEETQYPDGKVERVYSNGAREVLFANGTRKEISSEGQYIVVSFFNGDIKQIFPDQHVVYYYAEAQTTHTTYPDKLEVLQFPNGQTEKHYPDGTKEITFPDQTVKYLFPNGTEESIFQDGTIMRIDKNGERILEFPNGQREIHTQHYKRREYPDGTVKTLHNDGRQETRYSTGRVRLKDKDGNVLLDRMY